MRNKKKKHFGRKWKAEKNEIFLLGRSETSHS